MRLQLAWCQFTGVKSYIGQITQCVKYTTFKKTNLAS